MFIPSTMGRNPVIAAPMPMPMNPFSTHRLLTAFNALKHS